MTPPCKRCRKPTRQQYVAALGRMCFACRACGTAVLADGPQPSVASTGEALFLEQWGLLASWPLPEQQYRFDPSRRWRLDFAWPQQKVAVEIESGVHRIESRFLSDKTKYNALQCQGWVLLRYLRFDLEHDPQSVVREIETVLNRFLLPD